MRQTDARTINKAAPAIDDNTITLPPIASLKVGAASVEPRRYAFRSFDRQWILADTRLCDRPRPEVQRAHSNHQTYLTSLLTEVFGEGPAAIATSLVPDLHHFRGSFGGSHVIPLWRDKKASQPNVASKLLDTLAAVYGERIAAEDLFAYCYALLATSAYVARHWDELTIPGPRVPIAKEPALFKRGAALGKHLLWLHTFGERFVPAGKKPGRLPPGSARIAARLNMPLSAREYFQHILTETAYILETSADIVTQEYS